MQNDPASARIRPEREQQPVPADVAARLEPDRHLFIAGCQGPAAGEREADAGRHRLPTAHGELPHYTRCEWQQRTEAMPAAECEYQPERNDRRGGDRKCAQQAL